MSRGKPSSKAFAAAVAVARARGLVVFVRTWPGAPCDFLLVTPQGIIAVCVRRSRRIWATIDEIERFFHECLCRIRATDHCTGVACEFWLWSPYGTMRFFRLEGKNLVELNLFGMPVAGMQTTQGPHPGTGGPAACPAMPGPGPGTPAGSRSIPGNFPGTPAGPPMSPEKNSGIPIGSTMVSEKIAGMPAGSVPPGQPVQGTTAGQHAPSPASPQGCPPGIREPAPVRYLRRRNTELQRKKEEAARKTVSLPGPSRENPSSGESPPPSQENSPGGVRSSGAEMTPD